MEEWYNKGSLGDKSSLFNYMLKAIQELFDTPQRIERTLIEDKNKLGFIYYYVFDYIDYIYVIDMFEMESILINCRRTCNYDELKLRVQKVLNNTNCNNKINRVDWSIEHFKYVKKTELYDMNIWR